MVDVGEKTVSVVQAARTLFRTPAPSNQQVHRVYKLMKSGVLAVANDSGPPLQWTTTEGALADFMAANRMKIAGATGAVGDGSTRKQDPAADLRNVYHGIWRDYFLAVMLRRRMAHRSVVFQRAVTIGQVLLFMALASVVFGSIRAISAVNVPPERQAIEHWIGANTDAYAITRWHDAQPAAADEGVVVEVEYRYRKDSPRWVHTDRFFHVQGENVREHTFED